MNSTTLSNKKVKNAIMAIIFLLGAVFAVTGYMRGEASVVFKKAVYICLECIGIG